MGQKVDCPDPGKFSQYLGLVYGIMFQKVRQMVQLLEIADHQIIAIHDDVEITPEMRRDALTKKSFTDLPGEILVASYISGMIERHSFPVHNSTRQFENQAAEQYPETTTDDTYTYVYPQYSVNSDDIPELIKLSGLQILRNKQVVYFTDNPEDPNNYKLVDDKGETIDSHTQGHFVARKNIITINDYIPAISHHDYKTMQEYKNTPLEQTVKEIGKYPLKIVQGAVSIEELCYGEHECPYTFDHELKHTKNNLLRENYLIRTGNTKLSAQDIYKLEVDNEITARLAEVFKGIEVFQRRGKTKNNNFKELSVLGAIYPVYRYIVANSSDDIDMTKTYDIETIVKLTFDYYKESYMDQYRKQYLALAENMLWNYPPDLISDVPNDAAYKEMRSQYYNFSIYNPATGNYINMDLSEFVPEIEIPQEDLDEIKAKQRKALYFRADPNRYYPPVAAAIEMQRASFENSEYGRRMTELQNMGLGIGAAMDWRPGMNIVTPDMELLAVKNEMQVTEMTHVAPAAPVAPAAGKGPDFWNRAIAKIKAKSNKLAGVVFARRQHGGNTLT